MKKKFHKSLKNEKRDNLPENLIFSKALGKKNR